MNEEVANRFYALLRELMMYANERLRIVLDFDLNRPSALDDPFLESKCLLVLQEIWANVDIIDDFIRDNAFRLPRSAAEAVAQWKNALFSVYHYVGVHEERAILISEEGIFAVQSVAGSIEDMLPKPPVSIEGALLPYNEAIVLQEPNRALGAPVFDLDPSRIDEEFLKSHPPISKACDLMLIAKERNKQRKEDELNYLLNEVDEEDVPPLGFHRGKLYGIEGGERRRLIDEEVRRSGLTSEHFFEEYGSHRLLKHTVIPQLSVALMQLSKEVIGNIARDARMSGYSKLRKAELADKVAAELSGNRQADYLRRLVSYAADNELQLVESLLNAGGERVFEKADLSLAPREPLSFAYREQGGFRAFVPEELRGDELLNIVRSELHIRKLDDEAAAVLEASAFLYGVIELEEAYRLYCGFADEPISLDRFGIVASGYFPDTCSTDVWEGEGKRYAVHAELSRQTLMRHAVEDAKGEEFARVYDELRQQDVPEEEWDERLSEALLRADALGAMSDRSKVLLRRYARENNDYVKFLIEEHAKKERKPLEKALVEETPLVFYGESAEGRALRHFLDGMVPDGENDYYFAERVVDDLLFASVRSGLIDSMLGVLDRYGFPQDSPATVKMVRLVTNLYNSLPSWENNGWSPIEQTEHITGKKMFFAPDGTELKPGRNDPCPCGSGKKYKKCCGR